MSKVVLDSSAFLAVANREPGADSVRAVLRQATLCAINLSEVLQKLVRKGMAPPHAEDYVRRFVADVVPFDFARAAITARLEAQTRHLGLSLADRACLALGQQLGAVVLTADTTWAKLDIGIHIELIRSRPG